MSERAWVRRILDGDRAAGERLVSEHYPRISRLLRHLTGSADAAEDLAQQTLVKAWQALATFRGDSSLATWLHRIAYHEYTHWLRARREHAPIEAAGDLPDARAAPGVEAVLLRQALAQLPLEQREAFHLYHVQELSIVEVAVVLDVPAGTVKSRLFHARRRLRELLGEPEPMRAGEGRATARAVCETQGDPPR